MVKRLFKSKIFLCILTVLITGTVSVYAITYFPSNQVTYDNRTSGLKSSDVQGAIDELYNTCSSAVSSGDYLYYAINNYYSEGDAVQPRGGTLYRCNADGGSCTTIAGASRNSSFGSVYANNKYMYYAVNNYYSEGDVVQPRGGTLYRCNADGQSCVIISEAYSGSFGSVYANNKYMYYAVNNYYSFGSAVQPRGGTLYRCNADGQSCVSISEAYNNGSFS